MGLIILALYEIVKVSPQNGKGIVFLSNNKLQWCNQGEQSSGKQGKRCLSIKAKPKEKAHPISCVSGSVPYDALRLRALLYVRLAKIIP